MQGRAISGETLPVNSLRADDLNRMSARKLLYRLMVFAPAIFLAGIGVHARGLNNEFDIVADDPLHERQIMAYVPYLRNSPDFVVRLPRAPVSSARECARRWVQGAESGSLRPLNPIAYEDTSSDGPKSQIFEVCGRVQGRLLAGIGNSVETGDLHQATQDAILSIKLANVLKWSDFISLFNAATQQRRALRQIAPAIDRLSPADRKALLAAIPNLGADPHTMRSMAQRSRSLFLSYRRRRGYEPLSIEDTQLLSDIPAIVKEGNAVALRQMRDRMLASTDDVMPTYCSAVRLGYTAQNSLDRELTALRRRLQKEKAPL